QPKSIEICARQGCHTRSLGLTAPNAPPSGLLRSRGSEVVGLTLELHFHVVTTTRDVERLRTEMRIRDEHRRSVPVGKREDAGDVEDRVRRNPLRTLLDAVLKVEPVLLVQVELEIELASIVDLVFTIGLLAEIPLTLDLEFGFEVEVLDIGERVLKLRILRDEDRNLLTLDPLARVTCRTHVAILLT